MLSPAVLSGLFDRRLFVHDEILSVPDDNCPETVKSVFYEHIPILLRTAFCQIYAPRNISLCASLRSPPGPAIWPLTTARSCGLPLDRARSGHGFACHVYDGGVADVVIAVPGERQLVGEGWSLRAERVEMLNGTDWRALIGIGRGLKLLVSPGDQAGELEVEAWAGEPEETDGVAVIDAEDGGLWLARIPLCSCEDRGCGNAGIQLAKWLPGNELPALVELLRALPWTDTTPTISNVLQGDGLAAIEGPPDIFRSESPGSYLYSPTTGEVFPLSPGNHGSDSDA